MTEGVPCLPSLMVNPVTILLIQLCCANPNKAVKPAAAKVIPNKGRLRCWASSALECKGPLDIVMSPNSADCG